MAGIGSEIPSSRDGYRHRGLGISTDITHLRDAGRCQGAGPWKRVPVRRGADHTDVPAAKAPPQFLQILPEPEARPNAGHYLTETASDGSAFTRGRAKRSTRWSRRPWRRWRMC